MQYRSCQSRREWLAESVSGNYVVVYIVHGFFPSLTPSNQDCGEQKSKDKLGGWNEKTSVFPGS